MKLGYDLYTLECDAIVEVLKSFKERKITVYRLKKIDTTVYSFYVPIYQRRMLQGFPVTLVKSIGVIHYFLLLGKNILTIIGCLSFFATILISHQFIWDVRVDGNNPETNQKIHQILEDLHIDVGNRLQSYTKLNEIYDTIKDTFKKDIDYLNIYQSGSVLMIEYTNTKSAKEKEFSFQNLYASKDSIIHKIDVSSGDIQVKEHQFVRAGQLLVANVITSTQGEIKTIPVEGKIYGYTYQTMEASIPVEELDEGEGFSYLLFSIRKQIPKIDKIDSETVLKYDIIKSNLVLKVQYVWIEDIAVKGEPNEATD